MAEMPLLALASNRRLKQVRALNPGHPQDILRQAVIEEAEAVLALANSNADNRRSARHRLRACQLRAANLDLSQGEAEELARVQMNAEARPENGLHGR